jgi:hypothetical protein
MSNTPNHATDNEPVKTQFPLKPKPHLTPGTIGGSGHRHNLTLLVAMTAAMSMPTRGALPPSAPKPSEPEDDSVA